MKKMKKIRNVIVTIFSVLLFLGTISLSAWKVYAQGNVTTVNRFYSASEVVSGKTTPNTRVKYVGKNNYGDTYGVFSAVSNKDGNYKIYVGKHEADTTFRINTYDRNGNLIEFDEVFVLKASLEANFFIHLYDSSIIYDQGEIGQTPIPRPMAQVYCRASKGSKIEVIIDDKVVKKTSSYIGDEDSILECPDIHIGDFVKIRVSKGKVIKTYELLATMYDKYDKFMRTYPISTSKITTWSDSISIYLPSNLKYSGLFNNDNSALPTGVKGVIKQSFDENTTLEDLKPLTLYDKEFENVINVETLRLNTSPKPEINPVSQISKEVTGTATANSLITVLDEQNTKLGESMTNENGRFAVAVNRLDPDTVLKVETRMPNTNQYDYRYTSVEEVYIDDLSDKNAYITGQSSFGTEAEVYLLESNPITNNSMMKSLNSNGLTTAASRLTTNGVTSKGITTRLKKRIGRFTIRKGSTFKLYIGKQKANSIIQVVLKENKKSLSLPSQMVKDKTAPVISNIKNNGFYNVSITPAFNEGNATIDGRPYVKKTKITKEGKHKLIVKDSAGNATTVVFTIDKRAPLKPIVNKIKSNSLSLSGKGEVGATIYIYKGRVRVGYTKVNSKGTYSLKIKKQRKGTILTVYAVDRATNKSKSTIIKVR